MQASGRRAARALGRAGNALRERDHGGGDHPVPSRTRQLSPPSPRVLRGQPAGGQDVALAQGVCCVVGPFGALLALWGHSPSRAAGAPRAVTLSGDGSATPIFGRAPHARSPPRGFLAFWGICTPEGRDGACPSRLQIFCFRCSSSYDLFTNACICVIFLIAFRHRGARGFYNGLNLQSLP